MYSEYKPEMGPMYKSLVHTFTNDFDQEVAQIQIIYLGRDSEESDNNQSDSMKGSQTRELQ